MTNNDWQNTLQGLLDTNSLPEGEEIASTETSPKAAPQKGKLTISYEKKGRGGKQVTIISGFTLDYDDLCDLAATLKRKLGTGGSARGGEILIQGDRRDDVRKILQTLGYKL